MFGLVFRLSLRKASPHTEFSADVSAGAWSATDFSTYTWPISAAHAETCALVVGGPLSNIRRIGGCLLGYVASVTLC